MFCKAPFPWFGGKSRAVHVIWPRFGQVRNYVEPFFGSGAVLFNRPQESFHTTCQNIETINDIDCYVANFWRALQNDPEGVASWCDWPVNEADLHARHDWLVFSTQEWRERMHHNPQFYDVKIAGWWVWGICQWIGGSWCTDYGKTKAGRKQTIPDLMSAGKGVHKPAQKAIILPTLREAALCNLLELMRAGDLSDEQLERLSSAISGDSSPTALQIRDALGQMTPPKIPQPGRRQSISHTEHRQAVNPEEAVLVRLLALAQEGDLSDGDREKILAKVVNMSSPTALQIRDALGQMTPPKIPQLDRHQGVHRLEVTPRTPRKIPIIHNNGVGIHRPGTRADLHEYLAKLSGRLRGVRIVCGDWSRVVKPSVTSSHGLTAVFLDPPYSSERETSRDIFAQDDLQVAHKVREWCIANTGNKELRIALCGHGHEHVELEGLGWTPVKLKGTSGYSHSKEDSQAAQLAKSETIWFSPQCVKIEQVEATKAG
jgi:D12 class N6 adenine-specific DNA methyltransferase